MFVEPKKPLIDVTWISRTRRTAPPSGFSGTPENPATQLNTTTPCILTRLCFADSDIKQHVYTATLNLDDYFTNLQTGEINETRAASAEHVTRPSRRKDRSGAK